MIERDIIDTVFSSYASDVNLSHLWQWLQPP